ncbi:MAG: hypothetical protein ABJC13_25965 [Acidobacteriota bacterium]
MDRRNPLRPARRLGGVLLALALLLALASPADAAPRGEGQFFASAWRLLSGLWAGDGFGVDRSDPPAEVRFAIDPNGRSQPAVLFGETGLEFDPSGLATPAPPTSNTSLEFDPNG